MKRLVSCVLYFLLLAGAAPAMAQSTAFTFQGKLSDAGVAANGSYDLQFKLFNDPDVGQGAQQGVTDLHAGVVAAGGVFTVTLDLGANVFDGSDRYLEIGVRPGGSADPYTVLSPRSPVTSAPYAIQALNAQYLGGVAAGNYVTSASIANAFVKNDTVQQAGASFNVAGSGRIGTTLGVGATPIAGITLEVLGGVRMSNGAGGVMAYGSPNGESGFSHTVGTGRSDLRFDGFVNRLVAGAAGGPPASTAGIGVTTGGRVVVGASDVVGGEKMYIYSPGGYGLYVNSGGSAIKGYSGDPGNSIGVEGQNAGAGIGVYGQSLTGFGVFATGYLGFTLIGNGGSGAPLCRNGSNQISNCSSSLRYKTGLRTYGEGMSIVDQLHPISFEWKENHKRDVGFGAEDVAQVDPLFVTYNDAGEIEGVKYDRLGVVFVNALREQQDQIRAQHGQIEAQARMLEQLQAQLELQQGRLEALRTLACRDDAQAAGCTE